MRKYCIETDDIEFPASLDKWCCEGSVPSKPWIVFEEEANHIIGEDGRCMNGLTCDQKCRQRGYRQGVSDSTRDDDDICSMVNYCQCR